MSDVYQGRVRSRSMRLAMTATAAVVLLAGCGNGSDPAEGSSIPAQDPVLVARGGDLYAARCAECHGTDLRGTERGPSHLSSVYEPDHHADAAFLLAVRRGVVPHHWSFGPMPPVEGLTDSDVGAIVAFVREQQRLQGFEPYPP